MVPAGAARDGAVASLASLLHTMVVKARLVRGHAIMCA
jgi:hypothetical protein